MAAYVESMKKNAQKEPPGSMADFKGYAVEPGDPALAKFSQQGPEVLEKAQALAAQYRRVGNLPYTEEDFIKYHLAKAKTA